MMTRKKMVTGMADVKTRLVWNSVGTKGGFRRLSGEKGEVWGRSTFPLGGGCVPFP